MPLPPVPVLLSEEHRGYSIVSRLSPVLTQYERDHQDLNLACMLGANKSFHNMKFDRLPSRKPRDREQLLGYLLDGIAHSLNLMGPSFSRGG